MLKGGFMGKDESRYTGKYVANLPLAARVYLWALAEEPAVALVPPEKLEAYTDAAAFGVTVWQNPGLVELGEATRAVFDQEAALARLPADPESARLVLRTGQRYLRRELIDRLEKLGYEREADYFVRGDAVEMGELRLEFFGDVLEEIHFAGEKKMSYVLPAKTPAADETVPAIAHYPGTAFIDRPATLPEEAWEWLRGRELVAFGLGGPELPVVESGLEPLPPYRARLSELVRDVARWLEEGYRVAFFYSHEKTREYLCQHYFSEIGCRRRASVDEKNGLQMVRGRFRGGFVDRQRRLVVVTESLAFSFSGAAHARGRSPLSPPPEDPGALAVGDYLVHPEHGIGRFEGMESREVLGATRDYLVLRYADEGRLYLPVEQLPLLKRHPGTSDEPPRLSSLGKKDWRKATEKARADAKKLAQKLLVAHAKRMATPGRSFPEIPEWDSQILEGFPHQLTPDQQRAMADVFRDLETPHPMDRLISGDVGFGKTEIALRAAHRVVGHGAQVAYLAPTTLLAEQHYRTFAERFEDLPVEVALLSRFTGEREAKRILRGLADGTVDIVIGTHRLLSEGVTFKELGLLIIDEEHRFGVAQKEKIKEMAAGVDVLSLSATPIPRTLYQALIGLKDVSSIQTPPPGRKPIQTVIGQFDPEVVREAVLFEMERGGKTFYVHDRIASIEARARYLESLIPEARIAVVHGRMADSEIEEVMRHFAAGAFDLLVATTIVESGLDIPEANTIIIERADKLGLATLYQLRGRVGRRENEAYAYLFHPKKLTEAAERRLAALADLTDLGSGHRLAEKDMEIRGVGNLLGPEQHGHVQAVSFEVYTEMLADAIRELKGEKVEKKPHVSIDLAVSARLTPEYVPDPAERSRLYGRLAETRNLARLSRLIKEITERFGPPPAEVENLFDLTKLRIVAEQRGILSITEDRDHIQLVASRWPLDYDAAGVRSLGFAAEETRYPPGFRIAKRGLRPDEYARAAIRLLYQLA